MDNRFKRLLKVAIDKRRQNYVTFKSTNDIIKIMWVGVIICWLFFWLGQIIVSGGCTPEQKAQWSNFSSGAKQCLAISGTRAGDEVLSAIGDKASKGVLFDSEEWKSTAKDLGIKYGFLTLACATGKLIESFSSKAKTSLHAKVDAEMLKASTLQRKYLETAFDVAVKNLK